MKKNLVIIPGAFPVKSRNKALQRLIYKFYHKLNVNPRYEDFQYKFMVRKFYKHYKRVYFLDYNRNLYHLFSKKNEGLVKIFLNNVKNYDVIAFSFGGHLIQKVLGKLKNKPNKIVLIGSLNLDKNVKFPKGIKVVNIYSSDDKFIKKSIRLFSKNKSSQYLENAYNLNLPGLGHVQLIKMKSKIKSSKNKTIFSIIRDILQN